MEIVKLVDQLRRETSDSEAVEVKRAGRGFPDDLAPLLSAFANRPGGGVIILGLDENAGFAATGVYDAKKAQQSLANLARNALIPPAQLSCETTEFEGAEIVVAQVKEATPSSKPISVGRTGLAYLRQYDGTFPLSEMERQVLLASRGPSDAELQPVAYASRDDLDPDAVFQFTRDRRAASPVFAGWGDGEIEMHTHITTPSGQPTVAGLLAFGRYPQSFLPNSSIAASLWNGPSNKSASQLLDSREFVGSIGVILEQAVSWVGQSTATAIMEREDGHLEDAPAYPPRAVRELVANALVHRDLGPYVTSPISLVLEPGQLVISNTGGLFGLRVEALGRTTSHLRNPHLAGLLLLARTTDGLRIIERLGSGIPRAVSALADAGMAPPVFHDNGVRFTARLLARSKPAHTPTTTSKTENGGTILAAIRQGATTVTALVENTGLSARQVRYGIGELKRDGQVAQFRQPPDRKDHFRTV